MTFIGEAGPNGIILTLYVQPRSSKNKIAGQHDKALKLCITTPPVEGKANKAVVSFIAKLFGIPKKAVEIVNGEKSRTKKLHVSGITLLEAEKILASHLKS